jgi:hypothetical protein
MPESAPPQCLVLGAVVGATSFVSRQDHDRLFPVHAHRLSAVDNGVGRRHRWAAGEVQRDPCWFIWLDHVPGAHWPRSVAARANWVPRARAILPMEPSLHGRGPPCNFFRLTEEISARPPRN